MLAYVWRLPRLLVAEARGISRTAGETDGQAAAGPATVGRTAARRTAQVLGGRSIRLALLAASLLVGLVIALLTVHLAGNWEQYFG